MKTVTTERCNTYMMYHSIKVIFPKLIKKIHNKCIPHYGDTKKNDTDQPKIYSSP